MADATEEVENPVLEHLRTIRADVSEIRRKVDKLSASYAALLKIVALQGDALVRVDRCAERIEDRLERC